MSIMSGGYMGRLPLCVKCFSAAVVVDPYDGCTISCTNRRCTGFHDFYDLAEWRERYGSIFKTGRRVLG